MYKDCETSKYYLDNQASIEVNVQDQIEHEICLHSSDVIHFLFEEHKKLSKRVSFLEKVKEALQNNLEKSIDDDYFRISKLFDKYMSESKVQFDNVSIEQIAFISENYVKFINELMDSENKWYDRWKELKQNNSHSSVQFQIKEKELFIDYIKSKQKSK